jgi:DNA-binding CsgD family transcriptional regulator
MSNSTSTWVRIGGHTPELTHKQQEIAFLVSQGYTNREIASLTRTSSSNVEKHLKQLRKMFNASNTTHLIFLLSQRGLLAS